MADKDDDEVAELSKKLRSVLDWNKGLGQVGEARRLGRINEKEACVKSRVERVQDLANEWLGGTFVQKNADYGSSYTLSAKTLHLWFPQGVELKSPVQAAFYQLLTRMLDKLIRTSNLVLRGNNPQVASEKAYETLGDNGVYSFMAAEILKNGLKY